MFKDPKKRQQMLDAIKEGAPSDKQMLDMGFENKAHYEKVHTQLIDLLTTMIGNTGTLSNGVIADVIDRLVRIMAAQLDREPEATEAEMIVKKTEMLKHLLLMVCASAGCEVKSWQMAPVEEPSLDNEDDEDETRH